MTAKDQALLLLFGSQRNDSEKSKQNITNCKYLKSTGRFEGSIFNGSR